MKWIAKRMREPSTWAGLGIIAGAVQMIAADPHNPAAWAGAVAGLAAAVSREQGAA